MNRLGRALRVLRLRGAGYVWYLVNGVALPYAAYRMISSFTLSGRRRALVAATAAVVAAVSTVVGVFAGWSFGLAIVALGLVPVVALAIGRLRRGRERALALSRLAATDLPAPLVSWATWTADPGVREAVEKLRTPARNEPITLGRFDNDGRLWSPYGNLPDLQPVNEGEAVKRYRFDLDLVLCEDRILVRKRFRGHRAPFARECECLLALPTEINAPRLEYTDTGSSEIWKSFVPGHTLRDQLVKAGADILTCVTDNDPDLQGLDRGRRLEAVWARGREAFDVGFLKRGLAALEQQLDLIHSAGVTGFSLTFGNVVIHEETGEPWFIDFDAARAHRSTKTLAFRRDRDRDRELFNRIYGTDIMTEARARQILRSLPSGYAPVDLGGGLVTRGFWSVDSGTGRWDYLNGRALEGLIEGKRILDLGSNNGVMPLMMLRAGARSVLGVERSPEFAAAAQALHRVFEWRDMRRYDFSVHRGDMRDILHEDWGEFDLVTAFASLYYLNEDDMRRVAVRARDIASVLVVQAKTDTRSVAESGKARKSSVRFLREILSESGFRDIQLFSGTGYNRPILVGRLE